MSAYLVTGANGFVGSAVCERLLAMGEQVSAVVRRPQVWGERAPAMLVVGSDFEGLERTLEGRRVDRVIHLAARVHQRERSGSDVLAAYRQTNVEGSLRVARAALAAGATRLVFVSSVKAMGEAEPGIPPHPWRESDTPMPVDPYGISKWEAERELAAFGARHGLECVVLRPPLVYGPGVRANFLQLLEATARRWPLPLRALPGRRSMIFNGNLVDAIIQSSVHPCAAARTYNVSDGVDLSVPELIDLMSLELGVKPRIWSLPPSYLEMAARALGRAAASQRLISSLRVDITKIRTEMGWQPPYSPLQGIRQTVAWYRAGCPPGVNALPPEN